MKFKTITASLLTFCAASLAAQDLSDIGGIFDEPELTEEDVIPPSKAPVDLTIPVKGDCDSFGFDFILNFPGLLRIQIETADGKFKKSFAVEPGSQTMKRQLSQKEKEGKTRTEIGSPDADFPNHILKIYDFYQKWIWFPYNVLPPFERYGNQFSNKNIVRWEKMIPNALDKKFRIDLRPAEKGINVYLDSRMIGCLEGGKKLINVRITGGTGPTITNAKAYQNDRSTSDWEVLDFGEIGFPDTMKSASVSLKKGFQKLENVPMIVSSGERSGDVSITRAFRGMDFESEHDYYLSRTSMERMPESFLTSVPNAWYSFAHVLFALDPDPKKERVFTLRLTRFCDDGRGIGFAHTEIELPSDDSKFPSNIKKVGTVKQKRPDGKTVDLPLYLGRFPVKSGDILDIITNDPHPRRTNYLDFEIFGKRCPVGAYVSPDLRPDTSVRSAVNIFGLTLQKSPLWFEMKNAQVGNIFHNDEVPETTVSLRGERKSTQTVKWTISDSYGKELKQEQKTVEIPQKGSEKEVRIPLTMPDLGHYLLKIEVIENGETHLTHNATFALLGQDTRLASPTESPFGSWWTPHHHGTNDPEIFMKIFYKAGIRRTNLLDLLTPEGVLPEHYAKAKEKYKMTLNQFGWGTKTDIWNDVADDVAFKSLDEFYEKQIKAFPECTYALVYHETFGDYMVPEAYGVKALPPAKREMGYTRTATRVANYFRQKHPHIKLVYGNNTSSAALTAALLKSGFNRDFFDFIGIETPGQGCIPERLFQGGTQGTWLAKETARTYGFDAKLTGCFEFTARPARLMGEHTQAEYFMRDALIGLAYGYETLGISTLSDPGNWYNPTLWGDGGLCMRNSLFYPKPVYVAYATMTRVLDQIKFGPKILSPAPSVYALEFERKRGDRAYAFWLPAGKGEIKFSFPKKVDAEYVEFFGKTTKLSGDSFTLPVSSSPGYLIAPIPVKSVNYEKNIISIPENYKTVEPLDELSPWRHLKANRSLYEDDVFRKPGKFELAQVNDNEKGKCIEVRLKKEGTLHPLFAEYTKIELKKPIVLDGKPDSIGLWVKGDGGWGKIGFEFMDSRGYVYRSEGNWVDFAARSYITFNGWNFIEYPIDAKGIPRGRPQSLGGRWSANGPGVAEYPLTLTGLYITLRRTTLNPAEMVEVPAVIRIKNLSVRNHQENQK